MPFEVEHSIFKKIISDNLCLFILKFCFSKQSDISTLMTDRSSFSPFRRAIRVVHWWIRGSIFEDGGGGGLMLQKCLFTLVLVIFCTKIKAKIFCPRSRPLNPANNLQTKHARLMVKRHSRNVIPSMALEFRLEYARFVHYRDALEMLGVSTLVPTIMSKVHDSFIIPTITQTGWEGEVVDVCVPCV